MAMSLLNLAVNNRLEIKEGAREGTGGGADFDQLSSMEHRLSVVVVHLCALMCTNCVPETIILYSVVCTTL